MAKCIKHPKLKKVSIRDKKTPSDYQREYRSTERGGFLANLCRKRYRQSERGIEANKRYRQSDKGKEAVKRAQKTYRKRLKDEKEAKEGKKRTKGK